MASLSSPFLETVALLFEKRNQKGLYQKLRQKAWNLFLEKGLPSKKDDAFKYMPLSSLYSGKFSEAVREVSKEDIASSVLEECKQSLIVFVDGEISLELSDTSALPKSVVVMALEDAFGPYGSFLTSRLTKLLSEEKNPFVCLNLALMQRGGFVYIAPQAILEKPIQVLYVSTGTEGALHCSHLQMFLGPRAEVKTIVTHKHLGGGSECTLRSIDVALEDSSHFRYNALSLTPHTSWLLDHFRASLKRDSQLSTLTLTEGSKTVRTDYKVDLIGENAEACLEGLWMLSHLNHAHTFAVVNHLAPYTRSHQFFKGILDDYAQSSFEGKIYVKDCAQKTDAYQLNQNLILGERAIANSKPNLEVFADDVKASHGATMSQINEEEMFYLKSRGLDTHKARELLVMGYCAELIEKIFVEEAKESMLSLGKQYLSQEE